MDGFTNIDIFETKGIEYIIIILFFAILIPFWIIINRKPRFEELIQESIRVLTAGVLQIPQGLFFYKNHTWARLGKTGNARVGLDDFLVKITGNITVNPLKSPGDSVQKGELVAEIDRDGKRLNIFSPLSGEIINANYRISDTPGLLNNDPYGSGWMYDIKPASWKAETNNSYLAEDATAWFNAELRHLKDFLSVSTGKYSRDQTLVFQEGGELQINPLADLQPEIWDDFQKEFLNITG